MIDKIFNNFKEHPDSLNMTYIEHAKCAINISLMMLIGFASSIIHAFFHSYLQILQQKYAKNIEKKRGIKLTNSNF